MRSYRKKEWNQWYEDARSYREEFGNLIVPTDYETEDGYKLGRWIERQRAMYNGKINSSLDVTRIKKLERIDMVWKLEYRSSWDCWMEQVKLFSQKYGNLEVPKDYKNEIYNLGNWIIEQRRRYTNGLLSDDEIRDLNEYGMVWPKRKRRQWDDFYEDARDFYLNHGNLMVPIKYYTKSGNNLGSWITTQRERYRQTPNRKKLKDQQIEKLNAIGMIWSSDQIRKDRWHSMYDEVKNYLEINKRLPLWPQDIISTDGRNMPNWIRTQRSNLSKGKYSEDKVKLLKTIGITAWNTNDK